MRYYYSITLVLIFIFSCAQLKISSDKNGVGPVTSLPLKTINDSLMRVGMKLFENKCKRCHIMEQKSVGPDISDLLSRRRPTWAYNFMVNKNEMLKRDSLAVLTLKVYNKQCGLKKMKKKEALAMLEYLRQYQIWLHEFNVIPAP